MRKYGRGDASAFRLQFITIGRERKIERRRKDVGLHLCLAGPENLWQNRETPPKGDSTEHYLKMHLMLLYIMSCKSKEATCTREEGYLLAQQSVS